MRLIFTIVCILAFTAAVSVPTWRHFGPWWGVGGGVVALIVGIIVGAWWVFHDLRITG